MLHLSDVPPQDAKTFHAAMSPVITDSEDHVRANQVYNLSNSHEFLMQKKTTHYLCIIWLLGLGGCNMCCFTIYPED